MESVKVRRWWRVWYYAIVAVAALFTVPSALHIPDRERIAVMSGWVAVALLYAALAWRTRDDGPATVGQDVVVIVFFLLAAVYEATWPEWRFPTSPAAVACICAATALGTSIGPARRWQPRERAAPAA